MYVTREKHLFFLPSSIIYYFLLAGHKLHFIDPCEAKISILSDPQVEKNRMLYGKNIYFFSPVA